MPLDCRVPVPPELPNAPTRTDRAAPADGLAIDLHGVTKTYRGGIRALRGVDMQVERGQIFGLLGPNGAGKSTLVKIMMTVVRPSSAQGTVLGRPVGSKPALARVGYLPEHHRMPRYLTGRQVVDHYGALAGMPRRERRARIEPLLSRVGMLEWADRRIASYSKGMMQRVGLAQAMINDPDLVVLDEPTDGVDPVGRREIREVLVDLKGRGTTVFLNSHLLSELEMVCDRVAIMVQGEVRMQGTLDELTHDSRRTEIEIVGAAPDWAGSLALHATALSAERTKLVLRDAEPGPVQPIIDRLRADGRTIVAMRPVRESLEDLFMRAIVDPETGGTLKPGARR